MHRSGELHVTLFRILLLPALALLFLAGTAQAYQARTFDRNADAVIKHLMTLPVFEGARIREAQVPWDTTTRRVQIGPENGEAVGAVLFSRDGALAGLRIEIPLLPSADPGLYAFADIAALLEPQLAGLDHAREVSAREAVKRWAGELGLESWMRPRFGAYRIERRVGSTMFVFEGVPLNRFWVSVTPVGPSHPVADDLLPFIPEAARASAMPVLTAIERGEYKLAERLINPHAEAGAPWALLIQADYGRPEGDRQQMSRLINGKLERAAEAGFVPAQYVLGTPDSRVAEAWLTRAANAGYGHAIALKARRLYSSGRADDPGARCDELAALQGNAMAQLRTLYRYAEGGGDTDTAYFWSRVALETFGESASYTSERYILNTLGVLRSRLSADQRETLEDDAANWTPSSFETLKPRYDELGCLK